MEEWIATGVPMAGSHSKDLEWPQTSHPLALQQFTLEGG